MGLRLKTTQVAAQNIRKESRWWRTNRPKAPALFREELGRVFRLIAEYPEVGALADDPDLPEVRRVLLAATQHYLYYRVNDGEHRIEVLAVWSTSREEPLK